MSDEDSSLKGKGKKGGPGLGGAGGDLRKKLLKSEQAKSTNRKTRAQEAEAYSRMTSPVPQDGADGAKMPKKGFFFTNTNFYAMMRLLEVCSLFFSHHVVLTCVQ